MSSVKRIKRPFCCHFFKIEMFMLFLLVNATLEGEFQLNPQCSGQCNIGNIGAKNLLYFLDSSYAIAVLGAIH